MSSYRFIDSPYGQTFTLILTEECNLRCKYCYIKYSPKKMNKKIVDDILFFIYNKHQSKMPNCIYELIGGEPLLEYELIDYITQKSLGIMSNINHKWIFNTYYSLTTNGTQFSNEVKKVLEKYSYMYSVSLSLDGNKEHHEFNRKNSFDDIMKNINWWKSTFPTSCIKSTLTKDTMEYWFNSVKFFIEELEAKNILMNPIFEEYWSEEDGKYLEEILYKIADYLLENEKYKEYYVSFFKPNLLEETNRADIRCGAGNSMLAFDTQGNIFPCIRFSMVKKPLSFGNIYTEIDENKQIQFKYYHNFEQDECKKCEANNICLRCIANDYSRFNSINTRSKNICNYSKILYKVNKYFSERIK